MSNADSEKIIVTLQALSPLVLDTFIENFTYRITVKGDNKPKNNEQWIVYIANRYTIDDINKTRVRPNPFLYKYPVITDSDRQHISKMYSINPASKRDLINQLKGRLPKELSDLKTKHREEAKAVTRLTMENVSYTFFP